MLGLSTTYLEEGRVLLRAAAFCTAVASASVAAITAAAVAADAAAAAAAASEAATAALTAESDCGECRSLTSHSW